MKDPFETLYGNEKLKAFFRTESESGRLAHAYILEGEEGSGRHTLAMAVARALAGETPEGEKIARGISPDVKEFGVAQDKKTFTVDIIRRLKADAAIKPNELPFKLYIISNTELMNTQAQNAALKLLEEPPEACYFFLLCQNASLLLPTVRSRAPILRMQRFTNEELTQYLLKNSRFATVKEKDPTFFNATLRGSDGNIGKVIALFERKNNREQDAALLEELFKVLSAPARADIFRLSYKLPNKRQELDAFAEQLQMIFRDLLLVRKGGDPALLFHFSSFEVAEEVGAALTANQMLALYHFLSELRGQLSKNINMQNARMAFATGLCHALS